MSFMLFPPELNSLLMYTGPGSAPLMAAATAWEGLAADLTSTGTSVHSVISGLDGLWQGVGAAAATGGIAPYVAWLEQAAASATQMGTQASAAAGVFETAYSATVPPPVIAANRALLLALTSTNFFGQNTPAVMATEAFYEEMWAQDGAAMDLYNAATQTITSALQQPSPPAPVAGASPAAPTDIMTQLTSLVSNPTQFLNQLLNPITAAVGQFTSNPALAPVESLYTSLEGIPIIGSQLQNPASLASYGSTAMRYMMMLSQFGRMGATSGAGLAGQTAGNAGTGTLMTQIGEFVNDKLQGAVGTLVGHFSSATSAISAKLGQAASMGALKVPGAWSMAADGMVRAAPVLPATTVSAPIQTMSAASGMPGGPFGTAMMGAMAGRGLGAVAAKAPKVIPRSPAGG